MSSIFCREDRKKISALEEREKKLRKSLEIVLERYKTLYDKYSQVRSELDKKSSEIEYIEKAAKKSRKHSGAAKALESLIEAVANVEKEDNEEGSEDEFEDESDKRTEVQKKLIQAALRENAKRMQESQQIAAGLVPNWGGDKI